MDLLERGFTWLIVGVLVLGIVGAAVIWLPLGLRGAALPPTSTLSPTASALASQATSDPQARPTQTPPPPTETARGTPAPTPSPRPAAIPTARAEGAEAKPTAPLSFLAKASNASRTTSTVSAPTGVYSYSFVDLATASGASLAFTRIYNSDDPRGTSLGPGWTHSYAARIERAADGGPDVIFVGPTGGRQRFAGRPDSTFASPQGVHSALKRRADGYELRSEDGSLWTFDGGGQLTEITSGRGATTALTYGSGVPYLLRVSDPDSRGSLTLQYDFKSGHLTSVTDWLDPPRAVRFGYDSLGRLASVTDREGRVTRYTYKGSSHLLAKVVDARGRAVTTVGYDDRGRVTSLRDAHAKSAAQGLALSYRSGADDSTEVTRTYPPGGLEPTFHPTSTETYDRSGLLVRRVTKPSSADQPMIEDLAYGPDGALLSTTRSGGSTAPPRATPSSASSSGLSILDAPTPPLVKTLLDALAKVDSGRVVHLEDAFGRVTAFDAPADPSDPFVRNGTWVLAYDSEDRLRFVKAPSGGQAAPIPGRAMGPGPRLAAPIPAAADLELRYDEVGDLVEILEPDGKTTRYKHDERGLLVEARSSTGEVYEFAYDDRGDPIRARVTSAAGKQQVAEYAFDGLRRLRRVTDYPRWPDKSKSVVAETVYDDRGGSTVVIYQR